ncbi:MAG TPA: hypothetical protein VKT22_14620 [Steroidobacteraceae bacterium]|nr:hypothetical protein [Steroidobacteraceae bacterium]
MSEVDRLSNSGLYPALPIAEKRSRKDGTPADEKSERRPAKPPAGATEPSAPAAPDDSGTPRPPRSRIDEYA